ncbi:Vesicle transport v-SNARE protein vti1 like [Verticillium longisporum]|nr:Vesicle transport v-SNARE protein vti1 like [Verticillium longisporum]
MASHLDTEAGTERFADYEAELKLVQADLAQKLDQIPELSGEPRKAAISAAERARQQLLSGSDRLDRSTQRLKNSQALANETEAIGASTLADLHRQRETIQHTHETLLQSEGYVDRSVKTLRGMARRMATNRVITIAIITILVLLIVAVIFSKFR